MFLFSQNVDSIKMYIEWIYVYRRPQYNFLPQKLFKELTRIMVLKQTTNNCMSLFTKEHSKWIKGTFTLLTMDFNIQIGYEMNECIMINGSLSMAVLCSDYTR